MLRRWCYALGAAALVAVMVSPAVRADDKTDDKKSDKKSDKKATVAVFTLHGELSEQPKGEELALFGSAGATSLKELVEKLRKAAYDSSVKGVVVLLEGAHVGTAQREELRQAIKKVRDAGKEV